MKNNTLIIKWVLLCTAAGFSLCMARATLAGQAETMPAASNLKRYEDKLIGFSIEYDAKKLIRDPGLTGPFVFRRESVEGIPGIGITAGPYPVGTALTDTADLISNSLPRLAPGSIVHQVKNQQLITLGDGSTANYFEVDWNVGGSDLIAVFLAAQKDDRLIVFGAVDNRDGSMAYLTKMVKSLRIDVEVDMTALRARGYGKDGHFVRTDSPAFTLEYPKAFQNRSLQSNQIFRAGIPQGSPSMSIAISALPPGGDAHERFKVLAERYANALKYIGSDVKIISQNQIKKYPPFDAYQIQIAWRFRTQFTLATIVHIIEKENQAIVLAGHTIYGIDELTDIFQTINLNP